MACFTIDDHATLVCLVRRASKRFRHAVVPGRNRMA